VRWSQAVAGANHITINTEGQTAFIKIKENYQYVHLHGEKELDEILSEEAERLLLPMIYKCKRHQKQQFSTKHNIVLLAQENS
jgi:hypothetical protein